MKDVTKFASKVFLTVSLKSLFKCSVWEFFFCSPMVRVSEKDGGKSGLLGVN